MNINININKYDYKYIADFFLFHFVYLFIFFFSFFFSLILFSCKKFSGYFLFLLQSLGVCFLLFLSNAPLFSVCTIPLLPLFAHSLFPRRWNSVEWLTRRHHAPNWNRKGGNAKYMTSPPPLRSFYVGVGEVKAPGAKWDWWE